MKGLIKKMLKGHLVLKALPLLLVLFLFSCSAGKSQDSNMDQKAYDIINEHFKNGNDLKLYYQSDESSNWVDIIDIDSITRNVGTPVFIEDDELKKIMSEEIVEELRTKIRNSETFEFEQTLLKNLILSKDGNSDAIKLSKPVVVGNIALLRRIDDLEIPIYIYRYESGKWKIIYTFYEKLIFH